MKVHVFSTNVLESEKAIIISQQLNKFLDLIHVNFDLQDCDHVLRIEAKNITNTEVVYLLNELGYKCKPL